MIESYIDLKCVILCTSFICKFVQNFFHWSGSLQRPRHLAEHKGA